MKKIFTLILGITLAYSCSTNSDNNQNVANYNGTYIGNVNVYLNNNFHSTESKTIAISASSNSGLFLMASNIFMSSTCNINNNILNIPRATIASSQTFNVVEQSPCLPSVIHLQTLSSLNSSQLITLIH